MNDFSVADTLEAAEVFNDEASGQVGNPGQIRVINLIRQLIGQKGLPSADSPKFYEYKASSGDSRVVMVAFWDGQNPLVIFKEGFDSMRLQALDHEACGAMVYNAESLEYLGNVYDMLMLRLAEIEKVRKADGRNACVQERFDRLFQAFEPFLVDNSPIAPEDWKNHLVRKAGLKVQVASRCDYE